MPPARKSGADAFGPAVKQVDDLGVVRPTGEPVQVDLGQIDVLKLPEGDPRRTLLGVWEQVSGSNSPDFGHGNYSRNIITFRADGLIDVARIYGTTSPTRIDRQLKYSLDGSSITISHRSPEASDLKPTAVPVVADGSKLSAAAPTAAFPAKIEFRMTGDEMTLGGRSYKRLAAKPK